MMKLALSQILKDIFNLHDLLFYQEIASEILTFVLCECQMYKTEREESAGYEVNTCIFSFKM